MKIKINGTPKEIADLVVAIQGQPKEKIKVKNILIKELEHCREIKSQSL